MFNLPKELEGDTLCFIITLGVVFILAVLASIFQGDLRTFLGTDIYWSIR